jgi:hypothetical protein
MLMIYFKAVRIYMFTQFIIYNRKIFTANDSNMVIQNFRRKKKDNSFNHVKPIFSFHSSMHHQGGMLFWLVGVDAPIRKYVF